MTAKEVLRYNIEMSERVIDGYLADLADEDLLLRPVPGMNHMAWQLGHLIGSERHFVELVRPGASPPLPDDFEQGHGRQSFGEDDRSKFYSVDRYRELWKAQRAASLALLDSVGDDELDQGRPGLPPYLPHVGAVFTLIGSHPLMHCGQFVAVRRALGKPIAM